MRGRAGDGRGRGGGRGRVAPAGRGGAGDQTRVSSIVAFPTNINIKTLNIEIRIFLSLRKQGKKQFIVTRRIYIARL